MLFNSSVAWSALSGMWVHNRNSRGTSVPQWCKKVAPEYPIAARRANAEGKVVLKATIDVDGKAKDIEVTEDGVGFGCARAAMRALKASRFVPADGMGKGSL